MIFSDMYFNIVYDISKDFVIIKASSAVSHLLAICSHNSALLLYGLSSFFDIFNLILALSCSACYNILVKLFRNIMDINAKEAPYA